MHTRAHTQTHLYYTRHSVKTRSPEQPRYVIMGRNKLGVAGIGRAMLKYRAFSDVFYKYNIRRQPPPPGHLAREQTKQTNQNFTISPSSRLSINQHVNSPWTFFPSSSFY